MPIRHPLIAAFFCFGGLLIAFGFGFVFVLGNMESGMSDSAGSSTGPSIAPLVLCVESFFVFGIIASRSINIVLRRVLALGAHIALLLAVLYLWRTGAPLINFGSKFIFAVFIIYAYWWIALALPRDTVLPPKTTKD